MAIELPNKNRQFVTGHYKSSSNSQGVKKHRREPDKNRKSAAQKATEANRMIMVLDEGRKVRWYPAADWSARSGGSSQ